ncbi:MAG TPA: hypothetical protein VN044_05945 [Verrucomicrobiae bacterium]|jgi:hypothetical protein|nr:hypothetical protein [Verrucomicrobiae bacterium]
MAKLLSVVGLLVICAGVDLLWQSRREIRFWLAAYLAFFRARLRQQTPPSIFPSKEAAEKRQGAMRVLLGMGFAFFLGPILIALGLLSLLLHRNL